jgi:hypothetical protein
MELYDGASKRCEKCAILASDAKAVRRARRARSLGETPQAAAAALFQALREMDGDGVERIFAEGVDTGGGRPRGDEPPLGRAAAFDILDVR